MHPRAEQLIRDLGLQPHPEGGHYAEVHRSAASTSIYFLLASGEMSRWHRVRSEEIWHFYEGSPLELLQLTPNGADLERIVLGLPSDRERPVHCVPPELLAGGPLARRVYACRLHRRAAVSVRRFLAAQGLAGAGGVDRPGSPRRCAVRVAYEYETHHFSLLSPSVGLVGAGHDAGAQQVTKETREGIKNFSRLETTVACAGAITRTRCPRSRRWGSSR